MARDIETPGDDVKTEARTRKRLFPPELVELFATPLQVGGAAGTLGLAVGTGVGIARDLPLGLSAVATGVKWFTLTSSFWLSRTVITAAWGGEDKLSKGDKIKASALAGGTAGMVGTLLSKSPLAALAFGAMVSNTAVGSTKQPISAAIVFSVLGGTGQAMFNWIEPRKAPGKDGRDWLRSDWSPLKRLTDDEYRELIGNKKLRLEVEIALIDDKIAALRAGHAEDEEPSRGSRPLN